MDDGWVGGRMEGWRDGRMSANDTENAEAEVLSFWQGAGAGGAENGKCTQVDHPACQGWLRCLGGEIPGRPVELGSQERFSPEKLRV